MKILIVGQGQSIHIARWINLFDPKKFSFYLFSSKQYTQSHSALKHGCIFHTFYPPRTNRNHARKIGIPLPSVIICDFLGKLLDRLLPGYKETYLRAVLFFIKPDIVHSVGIEGGLLLLQAKNHQPKGRFPYWIHTNWGHDLYLYGRLEEYRVPIGQVLENADYYTTECRRDVDLGHHFARLDEGRCQVLPTLAGVDIDYIKKHRNQLKTSRRKVIMIKGYQGWIGRSLFALKAVKDSAKILKDYTIIIYSVTSSDVILASRILKKETGLDIRYLMGNRPQREILRWHCRARISVGLSISDGISSSFLEAMAAGSFPIQSHTSCANEWIDNGRTGCIVDPEDARQVGAAIRLAIADDKLVDAAARLNRRKADRLLDRQRQLSLAKALYSRKNPKYLYEK